MGVLEILVPKFINGVVEEFDRAAFGGVMRGKVLEYDCMDSFHASLYDGCCVIGNGHVVAGGSGWNGEGDKPGGEVSC